MSNLFKGSLFFSGSNEKRVIDNNEAVTARINKIKKSLKENKADTHGGDGFVSGINAAEVEELISDGNDTEEVNDNSVSRISMDIEYMLNNADMQAKSIVDKARFDAANIIADAKKEAETIMNNARHEGLANGYEEGRQKGNAEVEQLKQQILKQKEEMEIEYNQMVENIEPELVETITELFAKITGAVSVDKKDMILTLVNSVLSGDDVSKNYIIRVSSEDVKFLRDNKSLIEQKAGKSVNIEIIEDMSLKKNQCLIDTDLGIYDASLDIQLENLINDIRILSCVGKEK